MISVIHIRKAQQPYRGKAHGLGERNTKAFGEKNTATIGRKNTTTIGKKNTTTICGKNTTTICGKNTTTIGQVRSSTKKVTNIETETETKCTKPVSSSQKSCDSVLLRRVGNDML
jgi:hypothetical protein